MIMQIVFCFFALAGIIIGFIRAQRIRARYIDRSLLSHVFENFSEKKLWMRFAFLCCAVVSLSVALMRPRVPCEAVAVEQEARDCVIVLDISRSMAAADCSPNRLACAKKKVKDLLDVLPATRVALVLFAGDALVQCPLTDDFELFNLFLNDLDVGSITTGTTALDKALKKAQKLFQASDVSEQREGVCVVLTDGEDFSYDLPSVIHDMISKNMHVFTLGIGTPEGAPVPCFDHDGSVKGHQKDEHDAVVLSKLNEQLLADVARQSGAFYCRMTADATDIVRIKKALERFKKHAYADKKHTLYTEYYYYPAGLSLLCFIIAWLL